MSTMVDQLLRLAAEYGRAAELDDVTVSWRIFADSKKLKALKDGSADLQTRRFEKVMQTFSDKWPDGAVWPSDVPRPSPRAEAA